MTNADVEARHDVTVAVVREKGARFQIERASIDPPRPHDVIVRVVATGVCHTDMLVRDQDYPVPLPAVLGHEGSGIVEAVGSAVVGVGPGDHVVMTWSSSRFQGRRVKSVDLRFDSLDRWIAEHLSDDLRVD